MSDMKRLDHLWWNTLTEERKAELISQSEDAQRLASYQAAESITLNALSRIAPCLIDGHDPDDEVGMFTIIKGSGGNLNSISKYGTSVWFHLCARCGVVCEEKAK